MEEPYPDPTFFFFLFNFSLVDFFPYMEFLNQYVIVPTSVSTFFNWFDWILMNRICVSVHVFDVNSSRKLIGLEGDKKGP